MNTQSDNEPDVLLEDIEKAYQHVSQEQPSRALDKQIIASAYQELASPNARKPLKISWWRRLSLPVFATSSFVLTAIATVVLFPEPTRVPPGTSRGPVKINIESNESELVKSPYERRKKQELPEFESVDSELLKPLKTAKPSSDKREIPTEMQAKLKENNASVEAEKSVNHNSDKVDSKSHKVASLKYENKEAWAREILTLLKQGKTEKAKASLVEFKKRYPDFPIDAQIQALKSM